MPEVVQINSRDPDPHPDPDYLWLGVDDFLTEIWGTGTSFSCHLLGWGKTIFVEFSTFMKYKYYGIYGFFY